jgi:type IV pilus assembly protein PilA
MLLKNKKGFTLVELLIVIAIIGIVSPLIFIILISGIEDYSSTTKYLTEQYSVMEVMRHIKQDVEEAKTITFNRNGLGEITEVKFEFSPLTASGIVPKSTKTWRFNSTTNSLELNIGGAGFEKVVGDLDVGATSSRFAVNDTSNDPNKITRLILVININTEFSVRYKNKEYNNVP